LVARPAPSSSLVAALFRLSGSLLDIVALLIAVLTLPPDSQ